MSIGGRTGQRSGRSVTAALATAAIRKAWMLAAVGLLAGCAVISNSDGTGAVDKALQAVGLQAPAKAPDGTSLRTTKLALRLAAGTIVNADGGGKSLPLVAEVYKLRDASAFLRANYSAFALDDANAASFSRDVVAVREIGLAPGDKAESVEELAGEAKYLGVVALFRSPAPGHWRFVFDVKGSQDSGVAVTLLSCAMVVSRGVTVGAETDPEHLSGLRCP